MSTANRRIFAVVTAKDIIKKIEALPSAEQVKVREWLHENERTEAPEMPTALDAAARSADEHGTTLIAEVRKSYC